jgi:hypothetical protein
MKFIVIIVAVASVFSSGCTIFKRDYPEIAHAITLRTAKQFQAEKGLALQGTGGGMIDQVNLLEMFLVHFHPLEVVEARKLALFTVDRFLENINADEDVRPYLNNYPFKIEDITIFLSFHNPDNTPVEPGKLEHIVIGRGRFAYKTRNKETGRLMTLFEESISEARENVLEDFEKE